MYFASRVLRLGTSVLGRAAPIFPNCSSRLEPSLICLFVSTRNSNFNSVRLRVHCYSACVAGKKKKKSTKIVDMDREKEDEGSFYVVRKGDVIGVYQNFSDCQAQAGFSICDPAVNVYKGKFLSKDAEKYLSTHGLRNALYTIKAADAKEDLFGSLVYCPLHQPPVDEEMLESSKLKNKLKDAMEMQTTEAEQSTSQIADVSVMHPESSTQKRLKTEDSGSSCILEFDGASKGNPGSAGAGAILRSTDGSLICRLREGLGHATNNVAEYRAMILGLRFALQKGFTKITVRGDSKLVCMQIQGLWKVKNDNIFSWFEEARKLREKFHSFEISHVLRERNVEADAQANLAIRLADGEVQEEPGDS